MVERDFDVPFIADLALHEKQIQQNYRPIIAVHKWFARRPGTLFRGLLLSEFLGGDLREAYFRAHHLNSIRVADPFMGGGTPLIEANRLGCDVIGFDINPMAYWIVRQEIGQLDLTAYHEAANRLRDYLTAEIGSLYQTECVYCGSISAYVKYFLWVKIVDCSNCGQPIDLFPGYLLAENRRHPKCVIICSTCGELNELEDRNKIGPCQACGEVMHLKGPATRNRCACHSCGQMNLYPNPAWGSPRHRMIAIEYHCLSCKSYRRGRFFKKPDRSDLAKAQAAAATLARLSIRYAPDDEIPAGDETDRLHRWGYRRYREMFNDRQLLGLDLSAQFIAGLPEGPVRDALATNFSDLLRYQNMLCRYDTTALKSLDIFSVHGFPVSLIQCESNLIGIPLGARGANVGSGGWSNVIEKYTRAKKYCEAPFETRVKNGRKVQVPVVGEWIGEQHPWSTERRAVELYCTSSTLHDLPPASLDAVLTDPPYFANVQYAELIDFCYVWLRRLVPNSRACFGRPSTRHEDELTGNVTMDRGLYHFAEGLAEVFKRMARALKPGAPFMFTYHHNNIESYWPIAVAILDAGLTCSAAIPCPAEMGASIHINGTVSSIVDTVFVCRSKGKIRLHTLVFSPAQIADLVWKDIQSLQAGDVQPTQGDIRCIAYGHLIRLAIWNSRQDWIVELPISHKIQRVAAEVEKLGGWPAIQTNLSDILSKSARLQKWVALEETTQYGTESAEVSF